MKMKCEISWNDCMRLKRKWRQRLLVLIERGLDWTFMEHLAKYFELRN